MRLDALELNLTVAAIRMATRSRIRGNIKASNLKQLPAAASDSTMKHDYRNDPHSDEAQQFLSWLETETVDVLRRDYRNLEAVKSSVFLYVNRAFEAGLPDGLVGADVVFHHGRSVAGTVSGPGIGPSASVSRNSAELAKSRGR